jgi:hypothetical protein
MSVMYTVPIERDVVDFESITVTSSAVVGLTAAKMQPAGQRKRAGATITVQDESVRVRYDPNAADITSAPGAEAGPSYAAGAVIVILGHNNMSQARFIAPSSDSILKVSYHA